MIPKATRSPNTFLKLAVAILASTLLWGCCIWLEPGSVIVEAKDRACDPQMTEDMNTR